MIRAVFAGFSGDFANVVVQDKIGNDTQFFVLPTLNITRKVVVRDFPLCQVVSLADFKKFAVPKHKCKYMHLLTPSELAIVDAAEANTKAGFYDCMMMEFEFGPITRKVVTKYRRVKNPCPTLKTIYNRIGAIHESLCHIL